MLSFVEFRKHYQKECKDQKKAFKITDFNKEWADYKKGRSVSADKVEKVPEKAQDQIIEIEQQPDMKISGSFQPEKIADKVEKVPEKAKINIANSSEADNNEKLLNSLSDGVHRNANLLLKFISKGKAEIDDDDLQNLNLAGKELIRKYDENGKLLAWAPEIVYVSSILSVGSKVLAKLSVEDEKKDEATTKP